MLKAVNVEKYFEEKHILNCINITLKEGRVFGLVGTNGAGKSTLLRTLCGIYSTDGGKVYLNDLAVNDNPEIKSEIGYLSDDPAFLHASTILQMGRFQKAYYPQQDEARLAELCNRFSLPINEKISSLSKGTQKRVQVCLALSRRPKVLLCDETFDGLDPVMKDTFRKVISEETYDRGMITVMAGHNLQEMEGLCDSVGFLHNGKILTSGDMDTVIGGMVRIQFATSVPLEEEELKNLNPLKIQRQGRLCVLTLRGNEDTAIQAVQQFMPMFTEILPLSLEEVFILEMEEQGYAK